jgi:hypothetical protein
VQQFQRAAVEPADGVQVGRSDLCAARDRITLQAPPLHVARRFDATPFSYSQLIAQSEATKPEVKAGREAENRARAKRLRGRKCSLHMTID